MSTAKKISSSKSKDSELAIALCRQISSYVQHRKKHLLANADQVFQPSLLIQSLRTHGWWDVLKNTVNVLYAPIYILVADLCFWFSETGWSQPARLFRRLPPGWSTHFQLELEKKLINEILGSNSKELRRYLTEDSAVARYSAANPKEFEGLIKNVRRLLREHTLELTKKRTERTEISISFISMAVGAIALGKSDWSFHELGRNLATFWANEDAASDFFLGEGLGSVVYSVFPAEPSWWQYGISFLLVTAVFVALIQTLVGTTLYLQIRSGYFVDRSQRSLDEILPHIWASIITSNCDDMESK